jgi:hypothetical protein
VLCCVVEIPERVRYLKLASPPVTVVVPAEPGSEGVNRKQTRRGSMEAPIQDAEYSDTESVVSKSPVEPNPNGDIRKVGILRFMY